MSTTSHTADDVIPASPIDLPSIADVVYRQLRADIAHGIYRPGPIRIRPIAQRFAVSATPVREALRRLEAEGLVTLRKNQIVINALSETELRQIFAIRAELETFAVRCGAAAIENDDELLQTLEELLDAMDRYETDPENWRPTNQQFHMTLYRAAENPRLESIIDSLMVAIEPYMRLLRVYGPELPGGAGTASTDHRAPPRRTRGRRDRGAPRTSPRDRGDGGGGVRRTNDAENGEADPS